MARPRHQSDEMQRRQVEALAGYGVPEADISGMIGIYAKTLRKHWKEVSVNEHSGVDGKPIEQIHEVRRIIISPPDRAGIAAESYGSSNVEPVTLWDMDQGK